MGRGDEELVEACRAGESSAFDLLVARWEDKIRGAAFRILGSEEEARDVAQEAFLRAYRGLAAFKQEALFSSWLYQITINLCRDRLRRHRGRTLVSLETLEEGGPRMVEMGPGAHELLQQRDLARAVRRAISELPEEQREVVILKEYQGLTFLEIAQAPDADPASWLRSASVKDLVDAGEELARRGADEEPGTRAFAPVVGDDVLPEHPLDVFAAGRAHPVPLLVGSNLHEGRIFPRVLDILPTDPVRIEKMFSHTTPEVKARALAAYPTYPHRFAAADLGGDAHVGVEDLGVVALQLAQP